VTARHRGRLFTGRTALILALAPAVAGVLAPAAHAEPVPSLFTGASPAPSAVTDAAGTLHVLWRNVLPVNDPVLYCRVPAGGAGCTPVEITDNGAARPRLLLRLQDGVVIALVPRLVDSGDLLWVTGSADGGTTWSAPAPVASGLDEVGEVRTRVSKAGADPNTPGVWAATSPRRLTGVSPRSLDSGPTGTWLLTRSPGPRPNDPDVRLWRWDGRGFALARRVGVLNRPQRQPLGLAAGDSIAVLDVDLAGRLHAVWARGRERCGGQHCLVYRRTDRGGFGPPVSYPVGCDVLDVPRDGVVAANSGGSGWIVWRGLDTIRAVPLVTPPRGSRVGSRRIGSLRVSVPDFYACAPPGGDFVHRLKVDGRRGRTRIVSVRFFFDEGQPSATDRRAPWRRTFRLPFASGTRHVAGAEVTYRLGGSAPTHRTVGRTFVMC